VGSLPGGGGDGAHNSRGRRHVFEPNGSMAARLFLPIHFQFLYVRAKKKRVNAKERQLAAGNRRLMRASI
jgi:hypothetical protein